MIIILDYPEKLFKRMTTVLFCIAHLTVVSLMSKRDIFVYKQHRNLGKFFQ